MAGQIIKRGERRWLVRWFLGRNPDTGKKLYASKTVHGTKRDARQFLNEKLRSQDLGLDTRPTRETLNQQLDAWLEAKRGISARTLEGYHWTLELYVKPELGTLRLDQVRASHVEAWIRALEKRGLSPRTIRIAHSLLGAALKKAVRWGKLPANPAALVELPKQQHREMHALSADQVARFRRKAAKSAHATLFDFLLGTGCRPGEAFGLRWQDLDLAAGTLAIRQALTRVDGKPAFGEPKTRGSRRALPLPDSLVASMREHRRAQAAHALKLGSTYNRELDLVFANEVGEPLDARNVVNRHFKPALEEAELPATIRLYDLRHTHATLLLAQGVHPKVAAERLGHATTRQTLDTYSHVLPGMQEEASRMLNEVLFSRS